MHLAGRTRECGFTTSKMLDMLDEILPHQYPAVAAIPGTVFHLLITPVRVSNTVVAMRARMPT